VSAARELSERSTEEWSAAEPNHVSDQLRAVPGASSGEPSTCPRCRRTTPVNTIAGR